MNILVGYDRSKVAKDALELAKKHAKAFDAEVHVITSVEKGPQVPRDEFEKAEKGLENAKTAIERNGILCVTHLAVSNLQPGEVLVEYAQDNQIDQIIVGVRRRSKVGKLVFGSTSQYVILEAPCPVLSVK